MAHSPLSPVTQSYVNEALKEIDAVIDDFNRSMYLSSHEGMLLERLVKARKLFKKFKEVIRLDSEV